MKKNNNLLIVDDEKNIIDSLARLLHKEEYVIHTANSGKEALEMMKTTDFGVIISDLMMPEMDGLAFFENVQKKNSDVVEILLTGQATLDKTIEAINRLQLFSYLTKPWVVEELKYTIQRAFEHHNLAVENKRLQKLTEKQNRELKAINEDLEDRVRQRTLLLEEALDEGILMLAKAAEEKDEATGNHVYRIHDMTLELCEALKIEERKAKEISFFSMIHDVGKIHIPDAILNKPGKLDDTEWKIMKTHTTAGEKILGVKPFYLVARQIARSHHENWDGTGYPDGLKKEEIPLPARIVALVDVFDALTHDRPYKNAWSVDRALNEMRELSGIKFDPEIFKVFYELIMKKRMKKKKAAPKPSDET